MFQSHFYHETIRNTVVAFGTLFDDIKVHKLNADGTDRISIQVPLAYAAREKYIQRLKEDSRLNDDEYPNAHVQMTLPRMSFNMTSLNYDASRKRNTIHRRRVKDIENTQGQLSYQYAEVPYNMGFELGVYASTFEDGLQIVEQIVPYFTPEFNVTFQTAGGTSDINTKIDLPIVLEGVNLDYDFLGEMETRRLLNWTLTFNVKSYLYGPVRRDKTIIQSKTTLFDLGDGLTSGQVAGLCGTTGAVSRIDIGISGGTGIFIDGSQTDPPAIPPYTFTKTEYQINNPAGSGTGDVIDGGGNIVGPTTGYKPFIVDRRPFFTVDFANGNKGIDDWRMTSNDTQITNPDATSGVTTDPQDAVRNAVEVTMQREYERGFRRFNIRTPMGSRTSASTGTALPSASWSAGDPNLGTWSDAQNIATVKSGGATLEYVFTTTGKRKSVDVTAATADRQQSFINFLKPWIESKAAAGDPVQVYVYDGYQLAFHDTAQTDPAKGNLAMVWNTSSEWSGSTSARFPIADFSKSSHIEFRENEVIPWRDEVGINGFIVDAASNAGDTAGNYGIARAPGYFEFYRDRGLDIIGEAVPMIQGAGGTYDLNPDLYKLTPYVGYGGGTSDGLAGNFWGNRNWRTVFPSTTDSEIHMVVQWAFQGAPGGINTEYWNGATYDFAGITAEIKQAHDNGFVVDAGFGPYLSESPAEEAKRSIVLDYIVELGGSGGE